MRKYLILGVSLAAIAAPALAQPPAQPDENTDPYALEETEITVTATGTRIEVEDTGQPVTVIGRSEIESIQGADITRLLERAPGVTFTRNGPPGATTGVNVRGAETAQLLVLVDGVRLNDPSSPGGGFDFGNLLSGTLAKLDLTRGSNSTIWGSDAIGGVLEATTRSTTGIDASAEYGARDTVYTTATAGIGGDTGYLGIGGDYYRTDGFSAAAVGTEPDGFEHYSINGRARYYLDPASEIFATARYAHGDLDIDGYPAPTYTFGDTPETQRTKQLSGAVGALRDTGTLYLKAYYSFADTDRDSYASDTSDTPAYSYKGRSDRIDARGEYRLIGPLLVDFGGSYEWTSFESTYDARQSTGIGGIYAQAGIEYGALSAHAGVRHDEHQDFGGATSFGADVSYAIVPGLRLRASVGEGFKAPTLYQLLSDYGNETLVPENSTSFDLGLAWGDRSKDGYAAVTLFRRDTDDQIDFVSCTGQTTGICTNRPFGTYDNVGKTRAQGVEVELGRDLGANLSTRLAYAFTDTENRTPGDAREGNDLARRPRHALTASLDWRSPLAGLVLGGDVRLVSDSFDDNFNATRLDGYALTTLRASLPVGERFELYGRVENLFDVDYTSVVGYGTPGRSAYVGARLKL
ncbi:TonB-dependent receptor [Erythrobacter sp. 3-20A1M]|uniref:TonB-dependent receptor plug domain-containing protein n=1 Tax=Erythrobacter sp. 3-20A1M TaxID=2653850 RepID=UPI001BFC1CB3|nr:TonB-dependent receptor [Erythrobacter sp. 3-20A1M]QWC55899.1 TonB-dependent receptor [Erythrobacter sp. 3-20A1M]